MDKPETKEALKELLEILVEHPELDRTDHDHD